MKINIKVRLKNKDFWLGFIPAVLILVMKVLALFGIDWDVSALSTQLVDIVEVLFIVLAILGVVNDPTTATLSDSARAMTYDAPKE